MSTSSLPDHIMTLDDPGDIDAPHTTASWARAMRVRLEHMARKSETSLRDFQTYLQLLDKEKGYLLLEDRSGVSFASLAAFCVAAHPYGLGYDPEILAEIQQETRDMLLHEKIREFITANTSRGERTDLGNLPKLSQEERARRNGISLRSQKKLDYLDSERDDLLHEVQIRAMSIDKAYRMAKGYVSETPFEILVRAWRRVPREDRVRFVREMLNEAERAELREELIAIETRRT